MRLKCRLHTVDDTIRARHEFISALIQDFKRTQRVSQSPMDMSIQFYQLAKIIHKLSKKYLEVIRLDAYNYTD